MKYDKLIRDRIPEIIEAKGEACVYHVASDDEYRRKLYEKLGEETSELATARDANEIADVLEVVDAIVELEGFSRDEVERVKREKFEKRGGFSRRFILDES
jgi:predicted house-cleaning noncanonical NTP pyrophosphatase (MazG superfamily)